MSKIIVIVGPTGVGKTKLSIELAKYLNAQIINADSKSIYKEADIVTAKVKPEQMNNITHHLLGYKSLNEEYSIFDFQKDGRKIIDTLKKENKNIIIVGGSGLYLKALLYNYKLPENKNKIRNEYNELTNEELKQMADKIYKDNNIHINNRQRLIRFINSYNENNRIIINETKKDKLLYDFTIIGLTTSKENLKELINSRVEKMFEEGAIEETKYLLNKKYKIDSIIGYKQIHDYLDKKITLEEAKEEIKKQTRKYAKRQYTWFNNQMNNITWFDIDIKNFNNTIDKIKESITK